LLASLSLAPALVSLAAPQPRGPVSKAAANPRPAVKTAQASSRVRFNRDIRPILSDNCFACHGPDKNKRIAGFRLDVRSEALTRGVIVPGNAAKSSLVTRIFAAEPARLMPPVASHKSLTADQKAVLKRWIAEGAEYEPHWAYIPPTRPAVPRIADKRYTVRNPIDAFIAQKLVEQKILPSTEADRRLLIRRVCLDLTGIPPTPERVEAFVNDPSPTAYEKVVDELLASPHYGERMASPWLDVVRYADTVGFHGDQNQNAWPYRDYVINSFNTNKPFDRFTIEQIAGDLLPNATPETRTATCFNRLNMMTREGGAQAKEYLAKYSADRVRTVGMTWLGSTFGCAECHDHKYDPIAQKDFYSIAAFFSDVKQWGVYADYGYTPNPDLKGFNNDFPFPPEIKIPSPYLQQEIERGHRRIAAEARNSAEALKQDPAATAAFAAWRRETAAFLATHPDGWSTPVPEASATAPAVAKGAAPTKAPVHRIESDGSVVLADSNPADLTVRLKPDVAWIAALRVELLPASDHDNSVVREGIAAGILTLSARLEPQGGKAQPVAFRYAGANIAEPRYRNGFEIPGVHTGWKLGDERASEPHVAVWLPANPVHLADGDRLAITLPKAFVGRVRVSISPFVPQDRDRPLLPLNLRAALELPGADESLALTAYLLGTGWNAPAFAAVKAAELDIVSSRGGVTPVMVTEAIAPVPVRVLPRGNWQDESGPVVDPAVPHFLPGYDPSPGKRLSRLDLAKWVVAPENPLTARVFVNRLWKQFFGNGLSGLVEDLGAQGEWPTHPELLDWLAVEFRDGSLANGVARPSRAWDVKHLVRLMVTSATYRQSSSLRPELQESDPNNRLLASQNPRRLEAEYVRDNALAIAGLLNRDVGGPPVKPYQPDGYYANIQFPDRPYAAEPDEKQWRRGVYVHWQRTFLLPSLVNFDAPSREDCIAARNVANTPQQALTLLNDPTFLEAARVFGASVLANGGLSDAERLDAAFLRAVARPAKASERSSLLTFLAKVRAEYKQRPEDAKKLQSVGVAPTPTDRDPVELAAWASVCRVILNLQETITRY